MSVSYRMPTAEAPVTADPTLTLESDATAGIRVITPVMETVDVNSTARFLVSLETALESGSVIVLDMHRIQFMDSSGLGALVSAHRTARVAGGDLVLTGLTPSVQTIFELVQLERVLRVFNDRDEALRALTR